MNLNKLFLIILTMASFVMASFKEDFNTISESLIIFAVAFGGPVIITIIICLILGFFYYIGTWASNTAKDIMKDDD